MPVKKKAIRKGSQALVLPASKAPDNLKQYLQEFETNLSEDESTLWEQVKQLRMMSVMGYINEGQIFIKLRTNSEHGHFKGALAEHGFSGRYAYERMQIAEKLTQAAITNFKHGDGLGISKLRKVAAWEEAQIVDFFEGQEVYGITIDQAQDMSSRDFEAQLKANKDETKALTEALEKRDDNILELEKENDVLKRQLESASLMGDWPDVINKARNESTALSEQALLAINDMEKLLVQIQEPEHKLTELQYDVGFSTLFHHLRAIQARVQNTLTTLQTNYQGSQTLDSDESVVPLGQVELQHAVNRRASLVQRHIQDKIEREKKREEKKAPRRGRPRLISEDNV